MCYLLLLFIFVCADDSIEHLSGPLDSRNGLTYIEVAEDLSSLGTITKSEQQYITDLYVLAAVVNPELRESAILGILSIEDDDNLRLKLQSIRDPNRQLVPTIVNDSFGSSLNTNSDIVSICESISLIRKNQKLTSEQDIALKPWKFMLPSRIVSLIEEKRSVGKLNQNEIDTTLKVELSVLGGATLWSADAASIGLAPVVISMSNDLATLMNVDPTKRVRRNGSWVAE